MRIFECVCVAHPKQQSTAVGGGEKAPRAFPSSARTLRGCGCSYSNRRCLWLPFSSSFVCKSICKSYCARSLRRRRVCGQAVCRPGYQLKEREGRAVDWEDVGGGGSAHWIYTLQ